MKPHLYKSAFGDWVCSGIGTHSYSGRTFLEAYNMWMYFEGEAPRC